ncbi:hypothetical protein PPL_07584 [Heterostelium album PN500]|uniref:Uncharacterized protein n=1 Tax=Heterostelium pallidum (strain ATCC 26659 / Pp 5 / PN500) TaxID=670386 RepID=D3BGD3_HETP5|nr:hypothetical protein PPL_07584 [Heterostelium album PN500]EFA79533.1 hypothetical protein PPL_07584 [Heterostelium album PN500]|eukprot:XP_020431654.1 hypothetical protein PPL_07584 [Heterostelium album PN500]
MKIRYITLQIKTKHLQVIQSVSITANYIIYRERASLMAPNNSTLDSPSSLLFQSTSIAVTDNSQDEINNNSNSIKDKEIIDDKSSQMNDISPDKDSSSSSSSSSSNNNNNNNNKINNNSNNNSNNSSNNNSNNNSNNSDNQDKSIDSLPNLIIKLILKFAFFGIWPSFDFFSLGRVNDNQINPDSCGYLADSLSKPDCRLAALELNNNNIGDDGLDFGAQMISQALSDNTTLTYLDLNGNNMHPEGCQHISRLLAKNTSIRTLLLGNNSVGNTGARYISDAIKFICIGQIETHIVANCKMKGAIKS